MNRVAVFGGLGNQMFQYALAMSMDASGIPTTVSVRDFLAYRHHQGFELTKVFDIPVPFFEKLKIGLLGATTSLWEHRMMMGVLGRYLSWERKRNKNIFLEKKEHVFDPEVFKCKNQLLIGTWQAERYFADQRDLIREVYNFKKPTDNVNIEMAHKLSEINGVAVHIRRGDYMTQNWKATHCVIDGPAYYEEAIHYIRGKVQNPVFYFFSDDMDWVKSHFKSKDYVFVHHNKGKKSYLDMYLMSLCKHHVISNSTFSWWAAWLANYQEQIVIQPTPWLVGKSCEGVYPDRWKTIDVSRTDKLYLVK